MGRPSSPRGSQQTSAFALGVGKSAWDTGKTLVVDLPVMLSKFGINAAHSLVTWPAHLGLKGKAVYCKEAWEAFCQQTQYDWEQPEEHRQRLAAAQALQQWSIGSTGIDDAY